MKVKNLTKKTIISEEISCPQSMFDKSFGMILPKNSGGLILKTRFGIHTFFMKKPIDVLIVDRFSKVVIIKKNLKPNRIFVWNPKFDMICELPADSVKKSKTELGNSLKIC